MDWIRRHPFAILFALAGLTLLAIILAVESKQVNTIHGGLVTISGGNIPLTSIISSPPVSPSYLTSTTTVSSSSPPPSTVTLATYFPSPSPQARSKPVGNTTEALGLPFPSPPPISRPDTSLGDALLNQVYSLIPTGFPVYRAPSQPARTAKQQALYIYGNQAGLAILTFENKHADMAERLKDWFDHRSDASYQPAVRAIATDMAAAGASLARIAAPPSAAAANTRLADSLNTASTKLLAVFAASGSDTNLLEAMKSYNASADEFTKSFVAVADLFSLNGVKFSQSDTGSAFSFPSS